MPTASTRLTTNGQLLDERWLRELGRRPLAWLNVSLDGATAEVNDRVRGPGTFDRAVGVLRRFGHLARFTLSFTVMRHNVHQVEDVARLGRELGAHTVVFRPLYPVGSAAPRPELMPDFEAYSTALARLGGALSPDACVRGIDPFSPQARAATSARVTEGLGCGAGTTTASISVQGNVNPCSFLGTRFDTANVRQRAFRDIWNDSEGFRAMRALSPTRTEGKFTGGCRARALAATGDVDGVDPWQSAFERQPATTVPPSFTLPVLRDA